ncbi:uncharacterized protein JCM6883_006912 [Sporobolomyces salmoneus]|uniref:uncharacterized protein n=1 Tax=Sporobolomyces salmoneus TaxID=183962 RepID=UPI003170F99F
MPSFKTCLVSLALAALSFTSASASTVKSGVVARNVVEARDVNPSAGVARRSAAAKALAKRAAAAAAAKKNPYSKNSPFLKTKAALAAARVRCGTNNVCQKRTAAAPANGAAVCISGKCTYRCDDGFAPGGSDGTQCVASATSCGGVTCPEVSNGYNVCDANTGACSAGCNAGFTLYASGNNQACFAVESDVNNCGNPGNVCPASYNGIGSSSCRSGTCKIACPSGYFLRKANSDSNPYYCYNGESSLVMN